MKPVLRSILTAVLWASWPTVAMCLPTGKAWIPIDTLNVPGHSKIVPFRLETDLEGKPLTIASISGGIGRDTYGLSWADTAWAIAWQLGYGVGSLWRVDAPPGRYPLLWSGVEFLPDGRVWFSMNEALVDSVAAAERIAVVATGNWRYSGAVRGKRRWAVIDDFIYLDYRGLRMFYSDAPGAWTEKRLNVVGNSGVTVAAIDDTTALVVWGVQNYPDVGIRWGTLRGQTWTPADSGLSGHLLAASPDLRQRPSGGFWLGWSHSENEVFVSRFSNGNWVQPDSIQCAYRQPDRYYSQGPDFSRDEGEYPIVAWTAQNARTSAFSICVCIPTDSGFGAAEELEAPQNSIVPTVARDRNEDAWVAWSLDRVNQGMVWTHTYTTVMTSTPQAAVLGRMRRIDWSLAGPAPGTWWAVLRARGSGLFEEVARVRAGPGLDLSWTDTMPPEGPLRYKVRRESVDRRYEWVSDEAVWSAPNLTALRFSAIPAPFHDGMSIELAGARAGEMELTLYDLHGRRVFERRSHTSGTGQDTIRLDFATPALPPGVYFMRARDAEGQVSEVARIVLLR